MKFWNWINGKKTYIGAGFLFVAAAIEEVVVGIGVTRYALFETPAWLLFAGDVCTWLGLLLAGGGWTHKVVKARTDKE